MFGSVAQPTFLYGCVSWTLTKEREQLIKTAQRKMVRTILGKRFIQSEDANEAEEEVGNWIQWLRGVTHEALDHMHRMGIPCWVEEVRRRKFRWAGHVCRREDGRWTRHILEWCPVGARAHRRPLTRWADSIRTFFCNFLGGEGDDIFWIPFTQDRDSWKCLEDDFAGNV